MKSEDLVKHIIVESQNKKYDKYNLFFTLWIAGQIYKIHQKNKKLLGMILYFLPLTPYRNLKLSDLIQCCKMWSILMYYKTKSIKS